MLLKYSTGDKFQYTAHFVDADGVLSGSVTVDVLVSGGNNIDYPVDITAPDGLFLAYIEFKAVDVSGGGGKFDLVDVKIISNTGTLDLEFDVDAADNDGDTTSRSEEHTSELQSLMRISYAVFCLKKKK